MNKIYLIVAATLVGGMVQAQQLKSIGNAPTVRDASFKPEFKKIPASQLKAEGDPIYEDDFSSATNWTFTDNSSPAFAAGNLLIGTTAPQGSYSTSMGAIQSTTAANGFALIDSDNAYSATGAQDVKLEFNTLMDFTNDPNVTLSFQSYHRKFRDSIFVEFNVNNGGWQNFLIELDEELNATDYSANPRYYAMNISSIVGLQANVKMRFRYKGEWDYAWMIDDVAFFETFGNEIEVTQSWMATAMDDNGTTVAGEDYYKIPDSQSNFPGFIFGANVINQGYNNQGDVKLSVSQNGGAANLGTAKAINVSARDTLSMETPLTLAVGANTFATTTSMLAVDQNPSNNSKTFDVNFSGNDFARHDGLARKSYNYTDASAGYRVGNLMFVSDDMLIGEVKARINSASTNIGQEIYAEIETFDGTDWILQTQVSAEITSANNGNFVTFPFYDESLTITAGSYMRVWVSNYPTANPVLFVGAQKTIPFVSLVRFDNDVANIFWVDDCPMITVMETSLGLNELEAEYKLNVYPNPASEQTKVSFKLKNASDVAVSITDLAGKVVFTENTANAAAGQHEVNINTANLAAGVYTVNFTANNSIVSKKLVVRK